MNTSDQQTPSSVFENKMKNAMEVGIILLPCSGGGWIVTQNDRMSRQQTKVAFTELGEALNYIDEEYTEPEVREDEDDGRPATVGDIREMLDPDFVKTAV